MQALLQNLPTPDRHTNFATESHEKHLYTMSKTDPPTAPRVCISTPSLNAYGTRVLTEGIDYGQYTKNPVLLYMHERGAVIGHVTDLAVEGDKLMGTLVFDEATERSKACKAQFAAGSLRMVSAGLDILEWSEDPALILAGQTSPTVAKSRLFEVSVVDIGANPDALVLKHEGRVLNLADGENNDLPKLNNTNTMDLKKLVQLLGLEDKATEADVETAIKNLLDAKKTSEDQIKAMQLTAITTAVDTAIAEKRLTAAQKDHFVEIGQMVGLEKLTATLSAMKPEGKISMVLGHHGTAQQTTYTKLSEVPAEELLHLRDNDRTSYIALYKAEYGIEPQFND